MSTRLSRRSLLRIASLGFPVRTLKLSTGMPDAETSNPRSDRMIVSDVFPAHPPVIP
jgi:hypothetical protein